MVKLDITVPRRKFKGSFLKLRTLCPCLHTSRAWCIPLHLPFMIWFLYLQWMLPADIVLKTVIFRGLTKVAQFKEYLHWLASHEEKIFWFELIKVFHWLLSWFLWNKITSKKIASWNQVLTKTKLFNKYSPMGNLENLENW